MESIGASIWEVPPGEAAYPYHFHLADEELVIVLSGRPSLRTPDGIRDLEEGDAVGFPLEKRVPTSSSTGPRRWFAFSP